MQPRKFPLSSWMTIPDWDVDLKARVDECADIGFTLIMSPRLSDDPSLHERAVVLLDLCAERNMQVILQDQRTAVGHGHWTNPPHKIELPADYRENAQAAIDEFADHPAMWAFYITDEPLIGNLDAVGQACRIVMELTDKVVPYFNLLPEHFLDPNGTTAGTERHVGFSDFAAYLDHVVDVSKTPMLSYDAYCSHSEEWGGEAQWYRCLSLYQQAAVRHNIPFWSIVLANGHWMYRCPTVQGMSWLFHNALAYGAQGIMYFMYRDCPLPCYGDPVDALGNRGPLYYQMQRQHHHFLTNWAWRYRDCRPVRTTHWPDAPENLKRFDGSGVVVRIEEEPSTTVRPSDPSHLVVGEFLDSQDRAHVLVANGSQEKHTYAVLTFRGSAAYMIHGGAEKKATRDKDDGTSIWSGHIMPGQGVFFRVEEQTCRKQYLVEQNQGE